MGQYYRACTVLAEVVRLNREICQGQAKVELSILEQSVSRLEADQEIAALQNLGNNLQNLGHLESSVTVLTQASRINPNHPDVTLSLANSYQSQYKDATNQLSISTDPASEATATNKAQAKAQQALDLYESLASSPSHRVHAQLNTLQLLLYLSRSERSKFIQLYRQSKHLIQPFISDLNTTDFSQFNDAEAINLQLKLSSLLNELDLTIEAFHHARAALIKANALQDFRLRSMAYGTLGEIYLQAEQSEDALKVFDTALKLAQTRRENSLAYQWSWQIAQIYQTRGQISDGIAAYDTTLKHLDQVRTMLVSANSDLQFSYKESVEPVYHQYLKLLLSSPTPDFQLVLETKQQLQVAELENYLRCSKLDAVDISQPEQSSKTTQIHIFKLGNQIEVITQTPQGFYRHQPDSAALEQDLFNFLKFIEGQQFHRTPPSSIQEHSQRLYQHLIDPVQSQLPATGALIFHLDSHFQNLPMALLHDGQDYLIKRYSIQIALNTQLRQIQPTTLENINVLFAGLSEVTPSFSQPIVPQNLNPLPEVEQELSNIAKFSNLQYSLLNQDFTTDRLQAAINQKIEVVHIASHGQFSSDPSQTFLLAYNEPITAGKFHDLLNQQSEIGQASLELLILSACETAKGDRRSALGIAGLAIQAGSQNTLASLWLADSSATTELITHFYQGLKNNLPKAQALQQAQLKLIKSNHYSHPYYWGNFILVGS